MGNGILLTYTAHDEKASRNPRWPWAAAETKRQKNMKTVRKILTGLRPAHVTKAEMKNTSDLRKNEIRKKKNNITHESIFYCNLKHDYNW
jgi:hypothetical protein